MNLRLFPLVLVVGCGGGKDPVFIPPPDSGTPIFPNSKNDMVYVSFAGDEFAAGLTPQDDVPDNNDNPLVIPSTGGKLLVGEMGVGGDKGDDYFERDTFLITTGDDVTQLTVRLAWDSDAADVDYMLFEVPTGDELVQVENSSGTLISNVRNEFQTFVVKPSTNYYLWAGVFGQNADDGTNPGGEPSLPLFYDLSVYGEAFDPVAAVGACSYTEVADATNDVLSVGATGTVEPSGQNIATTHIYCGAINSGHFVADPAGGGIVDADAFSLNVNLATPVQVTLYGATEADHAALAALEGVEYLILDNTGAFFERGFFTSSHGTFTSNLPTTIDMMGAETGPKSITIFAVNGAAIPANINYQIKITADNPDNRGPRLTGPADATEANDNF